MPVRRANASRKIGRTIMAKQGVKKLTHNRFWDQFLTPSIIGGIMLVLHMFSYLEGIVDGKYFSGLLLGLLIGQVTICLTEISGDRPRSKAVPRSVFLIAHIGILLSLATVSRRTLFAYFASFCIAFCFGSAVAVLVKRLGVVETATPDSRGGVR